MKEEDFKTGRRVRYRAFPDNVWIIKDVFRSFIRVEDSNDNWNRRNIYREFWGDVEPVQ